MSEIKDDENESDSSTPLQKKMKLDDSTASCSKSRILRKQNYRSEWEKDRLFRAWLSLAPDGMNAYCSACNCTILPRHASLIQHRRAYKHILAMRNYAVNEDDDEEEEEEISRYDQDDDLDPPSERFLKIIRDISSLDENMFGKPKRESSYKNNYMGIEYPATDDNMSRLVQTQSETNTLLHALINIQKERLAVEKEKLETTRLRAGIEEQILTLLNEKL